MITALAAVSYDDTTVGYVGPCIAGSRDADSALAMADATLPNFDSTSHRVEVRNYLNNFSLASGHLIGQNRLPRAQPFRLVMRSARSWWRSLNRRRCASSAVSMPPSAVAAAIMNITTIW